ncbi:MAG: Hsp20/alpha crystallin family protein [bacterium]|nr:Hsp20/alpha crystallin family protein [bacterium]
MKKPSFFAKLTGASDDYFDDATPAVFEGEGGERHAHLSMKAGPPENDWSPDEPQGELAVDVYQTPDAIVIKALVAGVQPASIDIALTREMLTISGTREDEREVEEDDYFQRELYWGSFSRTILLPEEVDVDMAEASEKHGILMIRLPKINKKRETKLKVRSR